MDNVLSRLEGAALTLKAFAENSLEARVILTENDTRSWRWAELFAKQMSKATKHDWTVYGWKEGSAGWDMELRTSRFKLELMFSDGNFGYVLTAYRLSDLASNAKPRLVTKVFRNNKELHTSVVSEMSRFEDASRKASPDVWVLGFAFRYENDVADFVSAPFDLEWAVVSVGKEESLMIAWRTVVTDEDKKVRTLAESILKDVSQNWWVDGMYPVTYTAYNVSRDSWPKWANGGRLATFDGKRFSLNPKFIKEHKIKLPVHAGLNQAIGPKSDQPFSFGPDLFNLYLNPSH